MKYTLVKRGDPRKSDSSKKTFAVFQSSGTARLESSNISDSIFGVDCNSKRGRAIELVDELANLVRHYLRYGYEVDLGPLGKFSPHFECKGLPEDKDHPFDPHSQIRKVTTRWTPSLLLDSLDVPKENYQKCEKRKSYRKKKQ